MRRRHLPVLAGFFVLALGCSNEPYQVGQVSGRISVDGKPVEKAAIMFQPVARNGNINPGPGSYGITDAEGRYTLTLIGVEKKGAAVGLHKVRVENYTPPGDPHDDRPRKIAKPAIPIPGWYSRIDAILEFEVKSGNNEADFPLSSTPPSGKPAAGK